MALAALGEIAKDKAPTRRLRYLAMNVRDHDGKVLVTASLERQVQEQS